MTNILDVSSAVAELLTAAEVARRLGLCRESINLAARTGALEVAAQLPGRNGARLFTEAAVVEWRSASVGLPRL